MKTELCEIAYKYGADKCLEIKHPYTPFYYDLFKDKKNTIKKVLEIGVFKGASLFMWREFFPKATIYGIDINKEYIFDDTRIKTYLCDQSSPKKLKSLIKKIGSDIDFVVDDGSHNLDDQVITCKNLMPLLKKSVTYVIEDVKHPKELVEALSMYDCQIPDLLNRRHHDSRLVVVKNI